jgi:ATP-binding cassette subfamily B protein
MTDVDTQVDSFRSEFLEAWPFNHLPRNLREEVSAKLQLCSFQPGQLIYPPRELPSLVHCIVQERVRILGPTSYQSPTLAVLGKGAIVGWESLIRRVAVGSVRAAIPADDSDREVLTLALPADEFETIALKHLMPALMQRISLLEVFDTLSRCLAAMPTRFSEINLKEVVQLIEREQLAQVQHWYPNGGRGNTALCELSRDRLWLVSGGESLNLPIGTPIRDLDELEQLRPSRFPVRLLGIDRTFTASTLLSGTVPSTTLETEDEQLLLPGSAQFSAGSPTMIAPGFADAPVHSSQRTNFSIWRSRSPEPVEDIVACFGMVCDRLQVPYRPDSLRRWLNKQPIEQFEPFDLYMRIAQAIGLNATLIRFTPTPGGINRLTTPAFIQARDVPVVLHDVTPTNTVVGSPRTGLLRLSPKELASRLTPDSTSPGGGAATCRAIVLERMPTSRTKRFGFHWFVPLLMKQKGILMQVLLSSMVIQILGVANPLLVQQVIDNVIVSANLSAMTMFGVLMVLFALLEAVLTILRTYQLVNTTNRMDLHLGIEIVRHMLRLPLSFFEQRPVGELSSRLSELENIRQFLTDTAITTVLDVVFSLFYIVVMFLYSARLTICVLLSIPIVIVSTLLMSAIQRKLIRVKADQGAKVQSYLVEVLSGVSTVKAQHMESLVEATWRERYVQYLTSGFTTSTINSIFYSYSQFLNTISSLLVLWVGAETVLNGELTLGGLIAFRILTGYVTGPLLRLARLWQRIQETSLSMELLADIAEAPAEELASEQARVQLPWIEGRVQFRDVSFGFKPGQLQLSNVSLEVEPGTFVGIVGQSGSGKSTLMKLLPRLYVPQTGTITIDGYDISKVDLSSLRSQVGIVSQDAVLFQGTVRDNITLFDENLSDEEVMEAARVAEAHDFIMQLPNGYNTPVGERGSTLSGGQRQRIAIARVAIRNPRLLIFDEATSALDYETERRVCNNLMQRFQDRTCFFITHRLNTIARADWILFMQSGMIAEQGTHQDLLAHRQLYYCLYAQQSRES